MHQARSQGPDFGLICALNPQWLRHSAVCNAKSVAGSTLAPVGAVTNQLSVPLERHESTLRRKLLYHSGPFSNAHQPRERCAQAPSTAPEPQLRETQAARGPRRPPVGPCYFPAEATSANTPRSSTSGSEVETGKANRCRVSGNRESSHSARAPTPVTLVRGMLPACAFWPRTLIKSSADRSWTHGATASATLAAARMTMRIHNRTQACGLIMRTIQPAPLPGHSARTYTPATTPSVGSARAEHRPG